MDFLFTDRAGNADTVVNFLVRPRLAIPKDSYPDYSDWLDKVRFELNKEIKKFILCISKGFIIGAIIFQQHKLMKDFLELKNISISPNYSFRGIGMFLLRNAEIEGAKQYGTKYATADCKSNNLPVIKFLGRNKYKMVMSLDVYKKQAGLDSIFIKELK